MMIATDSRAAVAAAQRMRTSSAPSHLTKRKRVNIRRPALTKLMRRNAEVIAMSWGPLSLEDNISGKASFLRESCTRDVNSNKDPNSSPSGIFSDLMQRSAWIIGDKRHGLHETREMWKPTLPMRRDQIVSRRETAEMGPRNLKWGTDGMKLPSIYCFSWGITLKAYGVAFPRGHIRITRDILKDEQQ